jgi:hypothetical protein
VHHTILEAQFDIQDTSVVENDQNSLWENTNDDLDDFVLQTRRRFDDIENEEKKSRDLIEKDRIREVLVEMMWVELTSIHSNSNWCELYCGFSKVQLNPFFLSYCDFFMSSHQIYAKKDTCFFYNFAKDKKYIKENLMLSNMLSNMLLIMFLIMLAMMLAMMLAIILAIILAIMLAIMFAIMLLIIINFYILYNKCLTYICIRIHLYIYMHIYLTYICIRINLYICIYICCVRRDL